MAAAFKNNPLGTRDFWISTFLPGGHPSLARNTGNSIAYYPYRELGSERRRYASLRSRYCASLKIWDMGKNKQPRKNITI
jgi:hypothetical protein